MAMIQVMATGKLFNGGLPQEKPKFARDPRAIAREDRGLKLPGEVFMIDESRFNRETMKRMDEPVEVVAPVGAPAAPQAQEAPRKPGRPKKVV